MPVCSNCKSVSDSDKIMVLKAVAKSMTNTITDRNVKVDLVIIISEAFLFVSVLLLFIVYLYTNNHI